MFLPVDKIEKSGDSDDTITIAGMASTPDVDLQQEQIDPSGIDASYLINSGFV